MRGNRQRFRTGSEVDRGELIVEHLESRGVPGARADNEAPAGDRIEHRRAFSDRLRIAGHHDRHGALGCASGTAGHRCVDQARATHGNP